MNRNNGRAIVDYKKLDVLETGLAVPKANPLYVPTVLDGYHPDDFIVDDSLVLYLPFYLLKGDSFKSVDRYAFTATVTGALWQPDSRLFDGSDDKITIPNHAALKFGTTDFTVDIWVFSTTPYTGDTIGMFDQIASADSWGYAITSKTNARFYYGAVPGAINLPLTDISDAWHHFTFRVNHADNNVDYRQNGVAKASVAFVDQSFNSTLDLLVGHWSRQQWGHYSGRIGEVRIYKRGLSVVEGLHNYNATKWRFQ